MSCQIENNAGSVPAILLMSHGPLCEAIIESASMINNDVEAVYAFPFAEGENPEEYGKKAEQLYSKLPEGSIVLLDLFCGTPFNQMAMSGQKIYGLSGLNLPMLLDALVFRQSLRGAELIQAIEESAKEGIVSLDAFKSECSG